MNDFVIYKATNSINGNFYIGASKNGMEVRRKAHKWDATRGTAGCRVFHKAIQKYGFNIFKWEIIGTAETYSELMKLEVDLIAQLKPQYNCTIGGEGIIGLERTKEWYDKVSKTLKSKGIKPPGRTDFTSNYKPLVCLNDGKFFENVKSAKEYYKIGDISAIFRETDSQHRVQGKYFHFTDKQLTKDEIDYWFSFYEEKRKLARKNRGKKRSRAVICITDGKEYYGLSEAARHYGLCATIIQNSCVNGAIVGKAVGRKLKFRYRDSEEVIQVIKPRKKRTIPPKGKKVWALETGELFDSIIDAAKKTGADSSSIYYFVESGRRCTTTGLTFVKI